MFSRVLNFHISHSEIHHQLALAIPQVNTEHIVIAHTIYLKSFAVTNVHIIALDNPSRCRFIACLGTARLERYHSNVKLFYSMSDRAAWSLDPKHTFKERSNQPPSFEAQNLRFLKEKTTILISTVVLDYDHNDRNFILTERVPGDTLDTAWASLSAAE